MRYRECDPLWHSQAQAQRETWEHTHLHVQKLAPSHFSSSKLVENVAQEIRQVRPKQISSIVKGVLIRPLGMTGLPEYLRVWPDSEHWSWVEMRKGLEVGVGWVVVGFVLIHLPRGLRNLWSMVFPGWDKSSYQWQDNKNKLLLLYFTNNSLCNFIIVHCLCINSLCLYTV